MRSIPTSTSDSPPTSETSDLRSRYDDLVARSPQGSIFSTSWWLDAVAEDRWRMHTVEKGEELVAAWPTVVRSSRWGPVHVGAGLTPFLGPILRPGDGARQRSRDIEALELLLDRIGPYAHLEARCSPTLDYWTPLRWHGFTQTTRYTWRLPPVEDAEEAVQRFGEKARGHIRAAEKSDVRVEDAPLQDFLDLRDREAAAHGIRLIMSREAVERIDAAAEAHGAREILVARDSEGRARAGAYLVHDDAFTYYLMSCTDGGVRGSAALVIREAVRRAARRATGFDFEGSMLRPVEQFVRGFGGMPTPYSVVRHTPSRGFRAERMAKRLVRRLVRR